jgi:hypothetical protein
VLSLNVSLLVLLRFAATKPVLRLLNSGTPNAKVLLRQPPVLDPSKIVDQILGRGGRIPSKFWG